MSHMLFCILLHAARISIMPKQCFNCVMNQHEAKAFARFFTLHQG